MKNLKKLLAVVLVVVLAFGIMATAAAANVTDYSDTDDVQYTEAVDLFTALGFLAGMGDGTFDPQGLVTREQAAKIITYMLIGSTKADALKTSVSSFSDVAVDRWSAAYIEYCAAAGIINGNGDGTFNPAGNVTGAQFAKMLLCAIGYGVNDEYTGANWAMNTIADATSLGILSLDLDFTAPATREEVSQYGFNAYTTSNTVVYNSTTQAYQQAINIDGVSAKGTLATQQGVNNTTSTYTSNGTTYYKWTKFGVELTGGYSKEVVIGTSMDGTAIATLTNSTSTKYIASLAVGATTYYNGTLSTSVATAANTAAVTQGNVYYNTTSSDFRVAVGTTANNAVDPLAVSRGATVTLVNTDTDSAAEKVLVVSKVVAVLSGDPIVNTTSNTVTITAIPGLTAIPTVKVDGYTDLASGDVILWYMDNNSVYHIEKATSVTGTLTGYMTGVMATVDSSTSYFYSGLAGMLSSTTVEGWAGLADTTFYLDNGGYICYAKQATVTNPAGGYAFLVSTAASGYTTQGLVIMSDGTRSVVTIDTANSAALTANTFYAYSVNSSGASVLKAIPATYAQATYDTTATTGAASPNITKGMVNYLSTTTYQANAKTRFVYQNYTTATASTLYAYTGISNAPTFTGKVGVDNSAPADGDYVDAGDIAPTSIFALNSSAGATATSIFVVAVSPVSQNAFTPTTTTGDWVYITSTTVTTNVVSSTLTTYTYNALVNGVPDTITTASNTLLNAVGLYLVNGYDADGYATLVDTTPALQVDLNGGAAGYTITVAADALNTSSGTITADGTNYYVLNSGVTFYRVDTSTVATTGMVSTYELSAAQVNALTSTGMKADFVQTSGTDTSIIAVYIYA